VKRPIFELTFGLGALAAGTYVASQAPAGIGARPAALEQPQRRSGRAN
jgi:hypothetical protein